MSHNDSPLSNEEHLKAENDFIKMKLMLEHGAKFSEGNSSLPPEMENEFLNHIMAFEEQSKNPKYIKVYDRIGRPAHFKPVAEITEGDMQSEWEKLLEHLYRYHISLDVCSPNITVRELYRFTTEELFEYEMDDMNVPGMMSNFIYDEFHPDPIYDNGRMAVDDCIKLILCKRPLEWTLGFCEENLKLNNNFPLTIDELKEHVNRFKDFFDELEWTDVTCTSCTVQNAESMAMGTYNAEALVNSEEMTMSGNWIIYMKWNDEIGYWYITSVSIEGLEF